ncbi:MAG: HPr family phosphocarrier protein [Eubacteriales bacterium]
MKVFQIKLSLTKDTKDFVRITARQPFDIDLQSGRYIVDAKSIMGIFSLDLTKPVQVTIHSDDCDELLKELEVYKV